MAVSPTLRVFRWGGLWHTSHTSRPLDPTRSSSEPSVLSMTLPTLLLESGNVNLEPLDPIAEDSLGRIEEACRSRDVTA